MPVSLGQRILVVDDDPMVASTIERVLRPEGYDVDIALGGLAALSRAREHRPDLVVLDVMMPGIDGLEVCRQLRAGDDLPILLLQTVRLSRAAGSGSGAAPPYVARKGRNASVCRPVDGPNCP